MSETENILDAVDAIAAALRTWSNEADENAARDAAAAVIKNCNVLRGHPKTSNLVNACDAFVIPFNTPGSPPDLLPTARANKAKLLKAIRDLDDPPIVQTPAALF